MSIIMKTCTKCRTTKVSTEFHRRAESSDGLFSRCKTCISDDNRDQRAARKVAPRPPHDLSRSGEPWEDWEHDYLQAHPEMFNVDIARHLKRGTGGVKAARARLAKLYNFADAA